MNGHLQLDFGYPQEDGASRVRVIRQEPPLRVVRSFAMPDGAALVHLHNTSGGILGGDQLVLEATIQPGACAHITSTGSTRLYRQRSDGRPASQRTHLRVDGGGLLEFLPDSIIPYAGSHYQQQTEIDLADDAGLFYWEMIAPGREARGEKFQYDRLHLSLAIRAAGQPIVLERVLLQPATRPVASLARLGQYAHSGVFYICRVGVAASQWLALETQLAEMLESHSTESLWGVSTLVAHGVVVRALSMNSRSIMAGFVRVWQAAKRQLYQCEAILPRKIY